ncbi:hypothetical protein KF707_19505 [Candidatus Obscuribacterales bacterium]|nr:hypothetical protein [Cyclobacteriaceae bacterium]MBX3138423.1 hypothetical protein [Candidatus Obscuribacterales bacterium]
MISEHKGILVAILLSLFMTSTAAQGIKDIVEKWVDVGNSQIGRFSIRAYPPDGKKSLFKDQNNEYHWYLRIDYKAPQKGVAYKVTRAFISCDKRNITWDQSIEYTRAGKVVNIVGEEGGIRNAIPSPPDSMGAAIVKFVCEVRFDG